MQSSGENFEKAREWRVPAVSIQWLNDVLLGSANADQSMNNPRYQQLKPEVFIPPLVTFKVLKCYSSHKSGPLGFCRKLVEGVKSYYEARYGCQNSMFRSLGTLGGRQV